MPKEKKTVELKDEELEQVGGGYFKDGQPTCPKNFRQCGPACDGCPHLYVDGGGMKCGVNFSVYNQLTVNYDL